MAEYANPTAQLEEEILAGILEHPRHPVLDWQVGHCHVHKNKFTKQRRPVKPSDDSGDPRTIDGVAALVMGIWPPALFVAGLLVGMWGFRRLPA